MLKKVLKNRYIKDNMIMMVSTVLGGFLGYLFHFVVSRQISVAQYGELQTLLSASLIFGILNSALSYFVIKHTSVFAAHDDRSANLEFIRDFRPKIFKTAFILLALLLILSPVLSKLLNFSSYLGFFVISIATFLSTLAVIYSEVLRGWQDFISVSLVGIIATIVKLVSGSGLAYFSHRASIVSFSFLLAAVAGWYLAKRWSEKKIGATDGKNNLADLPVNIALEKSAGWKEKYFSEADLRKTAMRVFLFSLAIVLISNLDVILVKYFSSAETTGYYGAFSLIGKIVLWLNLTVVGVMLPGACADGHSGRRPDKRNLAYSYGLMAMIASGLILIYLVAPDFTISLFFGKKFIFDAHILWLFGLMSFLLSILTLEANLSFAKHDFRVVYFLAATLLVMAAGVAKYHDNLREIALVFSVSFLFGYILITALNLYHEKRSRNL